MFTRIRWFTLGIVAALTLTAAIIAIGQSALPQLSPITIDIAQTVPVEAALLVPVEDGDPVTLTVPLTVGVNLQISLSGDQVIDVRTLAASQPAVTVAQPTPASAPAGAIVIEGEGAQTTEPISLSKGLARFTILHDGHFLTTTLLDSNGNFVELIAILSQEDETSKALSIDRAGNYLVDVAADGAWTITVTQ